MASAIFIALVVVGLSAAAYFFLRRSWDEGINNLDPEGGMRSDATPAQHATTNELMATLWMALGLCAIAIIFIVLMVVLIGDGPPSSRKVEAVPEFRNLAQGLV